MNTMLFSETINNIPYRLVMMGRRAENPLLITKEWKRIEHSNQLFTENDSNNNRQQSA